MVRKTRENETIIIDMALFTIISIWIFAHIYLFSIYYIPFGFLYSIFLGLITIIGLCILLIIVYFVIVQKRKGMLKRSITSYKPWIKKVSFSYALSENVLSRYSKKKLLIGYFAFLLFRYIVAVVFLLILISFRQIFLTVFLFVVVTELIDLNFDTAFIYAIREDLSNKLAFFDDLTDIIGRITFYGIFNIFWINYMNLVQVVALVLILIFGFRNKWIKLFGTDINYACVIFFLPAFSDFFVFGLIFSWWIYIVLYLHHLFDRHMLLKS